VDVDGGEFHSFTGKRKVIFLSEWVLWFACVWMGGGCGLEEENKKEVPKAVKL